MVRFSALAFALLWLGACTQHQYQGPVTVPASSDGGLVDLTEHVRDGFLFSPYAYTGDHSPVALVDVTVWPAATRATQDANDRKRYGLGGSAPSHSWAVDPVDVYDALAAARTEAVALGADGIADLQLALVTKQVNVAPGDGATCDAYACRLEIRGIRVTGFALKRESGEPAKLRLPGTPDDE